MIKALIFSIFCWIGVNPANPELNAPAYSEYHHEIIKAETLIAGEKFAEALHIYTALFEDYDFVFMRDYQVAAQLAYQLKDEEKTTEMLRKGMLAGWKRKSIRKNKFLANFRKTNAWKQLKKDYKILHEEYQNSLDHDLRKQVKNLFSKDQWKAMGALFRFSSKAKDRYNEKKFAPHSEQQMARVIHIIEEYGYPGEQLIGNDYWMSTIISHHNSISQNYVAADTLYPAMIKDLHLAMEKGQLSPFEYALMDEWYRTVRSGWEKPGGYGILIPPSEQSLNSFNSQREKCFLRPIELRNQLIDIQEKSGMNFYLSGTPWIDGKIEIRQETP